MGVDNSDSTGFLTTNTGTSCGGQTLTLYLGDYGAPLRISQPSETALEWLDRRVRELQVTL